MSLFKKTALFFHSSQMSHEIKPVGEKIKSLKRDVSYIQCHTACEHLLVNILIATFRGMFSVNREEISS